MRPRAVIFDLWETLIDWDREAAAAMVAAVTEHAPDFQARWYGVPEQVHGGRSGLRSPTRAFPHPCSRRSARFVSTTSAARSFRDRARSTPSASLRELGVFVGLITVCSEDVERALAVESEFAGLFDAEVFSSSVGLSKPDPRIYLRCCELLGVEPGEAVFVGDGANDELAGARAGRDACDPHPPGGRAAALGRS